MMRKWDAGKALEVIEHEKVTRFTGVPTMMRDLMEHPNFTAERCVSPFKLCVCDVPNVSILLYIYD
jgi:acyl-CoA synthetase (AMP-forming)/AMP-acid ligase II